MYLPNFPVEIWHKILQEAISVPKALDVNYIPEITGLFEAEDSPYRRNYIDSYSFYEQSEYRRNILQRVCKAWDRFLRRFEHRYVQILDVYHKRVPAAALCKAIRIRYTACSILNQCAFCCRFRHERDQKERLRRLLVNAGKLSVEILDGGNCRTVLWDVLPESYAQIDMPNLRVILNAAIGFGFDSRIIYGWMNLLHRSQKLKLVHYYHYENQYLEFFETSKESVANSVEDHNNGQIKSDNVDVTVPSALHSRSQGLYGNLEEYIPEISLFIPLFKVVGHRLRSLDTGSYYISPKTFPRDILELCPKLERLGTHLCLRHSPPPNHPLSMISIFVPYTLPGARHDGVVSPFPSSLKEWVSLQRIVVTTKWVWVKSGEDSIFEEICRWGNICEELGVALVDEDGKLFESSRMKKIVIV